MEQKYYDLIISLIKEHRKFQGYEPILDEIAKDVYEHSKVVLGSIINDDVIKSYINKVIAVSIITVSKKLGYKNKERRTYIPNIERAKSFSFNTSDATNETSPIVEHYTVTEGVQDSINTIEEIVEENTIEDLPVEEEENNSEQLEFAKDEDTTDNFIDLEISSNETSMTLDFVQDEPSIENTATETKDENIETLEVEPQKEDNDFLEDFSTVTNDVDITLVDNMINGVPVEKEIEQVEEEVTFEPGLPVENTSVEEIEPELDTDFISDIDNANEPMLQAEEETEFIEPGIGTEFTQEISSETTEEEDTKELDLEDLTLENSDNLIKFDSDNSFDISLNTEDDTSSFIEDTESQLIEAEEQAELDVEVSTELDMDISLDESFEIPESLEQEEQSHSEISEIDYKLPDYSSFNFETNPQDINTDEICNELIELDKKYPDKNILEICRLKYTDKLSVSEIANKLEIGIENVIETLDQIINTVKE